MSHSSPMNGISVQHKKAARTLSMHSKCNARREGTLQALWRCLPLGRSCLGEWGRVQRSDRRPRALPSRSCCPVSYSPLTGPRLWPLHYLPVLPISSTEPASAPTGLVEAFNTSKRHQQALIVTTFTIIIINHLTRASCTSPLLEHVHGV